MIALAAYLIAQTPITVGLIGGTAELCAQVQGILGKAYVVYGRTAGFEIFGYRSKFTAIVWLDSMEPLNWSRYRSRFVESFKWVLRDLQGERAFVCLPQPSDARIAEEVRPLLRQAARESSVPVIDLADSDLTPGEVIAEAIEDPAARKKTWRLLSFDSAEEEEGPAKAALDGDPYTYWHTGYSGTAPKHPHELVIDTGSVDTFTAFRHLPRQDGGVNGRIKGFELYISPNQGNWGEPILTGEIPNTNKWTTVKFSKPVGGRYLKLRALSEWNGGPWASVAEIDLRRKRL